MSEISDASRALALNKAKLLTVLARYEVTNPRLFGSLSRNEDTASSDIDILVSKTKPMSYATIAKLRREASDVLGWPVDLVFEAALKPHVKDSIEHDLRPLT